MFISIPNHVFDDEFDPSDNDRLYMLPVRPDPVNGQLRAPEQLEKGMVVIINLPRSQVVAAILRPDFKFKLSERGKEYRGVLIAHQNKDKNQKLSFVDLGLAPNKNECWSQNSVIDTGHRLTPRQVSLVWNGHAIRWPKVDLG
jgi:hypothetical protein